MLFYSPAFQSEDMDRGFLWAFVPFTAAGQQGIFTPFRFFIPGFFHDLYF
jgi:hypothetical protein